VWDRGQEQ